jgi:hypothetical protein
MRYSSVVCTTRQPHKKETKREEKALRQGYKFGLTVRQTLCKWSKLCGHVPVLKTCREH